MIYVILEICGYKEMEESLRQELENIPEWNEYFAYWAVDEMMLEVQVDEISKISDVQELADEAVDKIIQQGKIEHPQVVLQALQTLNLEKQATMLRGYISLFLVSKKPENCDNTGDIKSLKINIDKFPLLVYSHCFSGHFKQAEVLLKSQEKQGVNTDYAFTIFASFLVKKSKSEYLMNMNLSERQKEIILKIFKDDHDL